MTDQETTGPQLTKNQTLVFDALVESNGPMSAYAILDRLRPQGFRAPLQVYRALEKLTEFDLVHKLESRNAFVACKHPSCGKEHTAAFAICDDCDQVSEITDNKLSSHLGSLADGADFKVAKSTVELHGTCESCSKEPGRD